MPRRNLKDLVRLYREHLATGSGASHAQASTAAIHRIFATIKAKRYADLKLPRLEAAFDRLSSGMSASTSNHYRGYLRAFCRWCVRMGHASTNPAADLAPRSGPKARRHHASSAEEVAKILEAAKAGRAYEYPAYQLAYGLGLRLSEVVGPKALRWCDVNLEAGTYTIAGPRQKSGKDTTVALSAEMCAWLAAHKLVRRGNFETDAIVPLSIGMPTTHAGFAADRRATVERAGLSYITGNGELLGWHSMRHTFITRLVQSGADIKTVQALARHASPEQTLAYAHTDLATQRRALDRKGGA